MLTSNGEENDVFFDTAEFLVSEEYLDYEIWRNAPQSVNKRRGSFLSRMGFTELLSSSALEENARNNGLDRLTELSGAVRISDIDNSRAMESDEGEKNSSNARSLNEEESRECVRSVAEAAANNCENFDVGKSRTKRWWKFFMKHRKDQANSLSSGSNIIPENSRRGQIKVRQSKRKFMELTALYVRQEFQAHEGFIWVMKFSPDGQYLASGGEDGVVRIWRVSLVDSASKYLLNEGEIDEKLSQGKSNFRTKSSGRAALLLPKKLFRIEESPIQEFCGHSSDVLDLAWSNSNCLLSSSMDKTVRLWQIGCNRCLDVYHHQNYVTCIQFNPVDENYFISGSVDGKVRIWGVAERRVVDWAEVRDIITAISYQPNGKGFVVGSVSGTCRFYEASGEHCRMNAEIHIEGRKKASRRRITGIQFSREGFQKVMITAEDSKLRIYNFDGLKMVQKYKAGPQKSGSQMSASFTSSGKHIVSVGENSRVYIWDYDGNAFLPARKEPKSVQSYEHFFSKGVAVAIPWSGSGNGQSGIDIFQDRTEITSGSRDSDSFFLGSWFNLDKASATWPEEKLPLPNLPLPGENGNLVAPVPETWGLIFVTAGSDGIIKTFHNYGFPVRI